MYEHNYIESLGSHGVEYEAGRVLGSWTVHNVLGRQRNNCTQRAIKQRNIFVYFWVTNLGVVAELQNK